MPMCVEDIKAEISSIIKSAKEAQSRLDFHKRVLPMGMSGVDMHRHREQEIRNELKELDARRDHIFEQIDEWVDIATQADRESYKLRKMISSKMRVVTEYRSCEGMGITDSDESCIDCGGVGYFDI